MSDWVPDTSLSFKDKDLAKSNNKVNYEKMTLVAYYTMLKIFWQNPTIEFQIFIINS